MARKVVKSLPSPARSRITFWEKILDFIEDWSVSKLTLFSYCRGYKATDSHCYKNLWFLVADNIWRRHSVLHLFKYKEYRIAKEYKSGLHWMKAHEYG